MNQSNRTSRKGSLFEYHEGVMEERNASLPRGVRYPRRVLIGSTFVARSAGIHDAYSAMQITERPTIR